MAIWKPKLNKIITAAQKAQTVAAELQKNFEIAIQAHIDAVAQSKKYANGTVLSGYVFSTIPQWQTEAQTFIAWRDAVWVYAYTELQKAVTGQREIPTIEEFLTELPAIGW